MLFLKKCWDWCVKHWKLTLALIGSGIAFIIGYTRANRNAQRVKLDLVIKEKDIDLLLKNKERIDEETAKSILDFEKKKNKLEQKKNNELKIAPLLIAPPYDPPISPPPLPLILAGFIGAPPSNFGRNFGGHQGHLVDLRKNERTIEGI